MADYLTTDTELTSVANAIRSKGGTSAPLEYPTEFVSAIQNIPSGGGAEPKVVHFIDYDGTVLYSYTASEAQALQALPPNPSHERLVAQGWNYTLSELKAEVTAVGSCIVGQMYVTASGDTEIDIELVEGIFSLYLFFTHTTDVTIDWGDGSETTTVTGSATVNRYHEFTTGGRYTIKISTTGGITIFGASGSSTGSKLLWTNQNGVANRGPQTLIKGVYFGSHESVTIREYAFQYCQALRAVTIPNGGTRIGQYAFNYCYSLTSITIPSGVTSIGEYAFNSCSSLKSVALPSSVTSISANAFQSDFTLALFALPSGLTSIGNNALANCFSLTSITIPSGVTILSEYLFSYCYSLTSITLPSGVTKIDNYAFSACYSLTSITLPSNLRTIGTHVFNNCQSLKSITIPNSVISIGNNAFTYCASLTSITIPSGVSSIGNNTFQYCYSLTSITIPNSVTSIGQYAFANCYSLTSITIPSGVTSLGQYTFNYCYSLTSIALPNSLTSIGNYVFNYCYGLTSITIPSGVTSIGNNAFQYCYALIGVHSQPTTPPTLGTNAFAYNNNARKIYVPIGTLADYQAATNWSQYTASIVEETA